MNDHVLEFVQDVGDDPSVAEQRSRNFNPSPRQTVWVPIGNYRRVGIAPDVLIRRRMKRAINESEATRPRHIPRAINDADKSCFDSNPTELIAQIEKEILVAA